MREDIFSRSRKFNPKNLFLSVLNLAASTNQDGYPTALRRAWQQSGLGMKQVPAKSSLSAYRGKVAWRFFEDLWKKDIEKMQSARKTFRGFYIYSIDGDDLDLPAADEILDQGYKGAPCINNLESYYPKMYTAQAVDVINGVIVGFAESPVRHEVVLARMLAKGLEKNSIAIYDRLHGSYQTVRCHEEIGSYFLIRLKSKNPNCQVEIKKFLSSKRKTKWIDLGPSRHDQQKAKDLLPIKVRLVKIKNPKSKEEIVFMTNLNESKFSDEDLACLYQRRWEVETNFRDLTSSALKMNQWHSKKLNGIKQEIYALLWLVNQVRIQVTKMINPKYFLKQAYQKSNFKLCVQLVLDHLEDLAKGRWKYVQKIIDHWVTRSIVKRKHLSRQYPRQVKYKRRKYANVGNVKRRS